MENQAGEHDASAQPTYGIGAHRKEARPVRLLKVRITRGRSQPNDGAKRGIDPKLWSHSSSPFYVRPTIQSAGKFSVLSGIDGQTGNGLPRGTGHPEQRAGSMTGAGCQSPRLLGSGTLWSAGLRPGEWPSGKPPRRCGARRSAASPAAKVYHYRLLDSVLICMRKAGIEESSLRFPRVPVFLLSKFGHCRLLEQMRAVLRVRRYALCTERAFAVRHSFSVCPPPCGILPRSS